MSPVNQEPGAPPLGQLTLRGFDPFLEARLRQIAKERDLSLNRAALFLMRRGAGLTAPAVAAPSQVGASLDRFVGLWSIDQEKEILEAVEIFDELDSSLWP